ncbi:MAG TPA: hypothetical protein VHC22_30020 [Pirellulales bacterium]|nr:hypothetical protein [Pirellulales bacterium]
METIPLEDATETPVDGLPLEADPGSREPFGVESLEDRVLPAADAAIAPPVDGPQTEPAAYVAAPLAGRPAIDLASVDTPQDPATAVGGAASVGGPTLPTLRKDDLRPELIEPVVDGLRERAIPEAGEFSKAEPNLNKFGLATIEPESGTVVRDLRPLEAGPDESGNVDRAGAKVLETLGGDATVAAVSEAAVAEVAEELAPALMPSHPVEPVIAPEPLDSPAVSRAEASDVSANVGIGNPEHPGDTLRAVHEALFADASKREGALERPPIV